MTEMSQQKRRPSWGHWWSSCPRRMLGWYYSPPDSLYKGV